jgi:hypothetical protein
MRRGWGGRGGGLRNEAGWAASWPPAVNCAQCLRVIVAVQKRVCVCWSSGVYINHTQLHARRVQRLGRHWHEAPPAAVSWTLSLWKEVRRGGLRPTLFAGCGSLPAQAPTEVYADFYGGPLTLTPSFCKTHYPTLTPIPLTHPSMHLAQDAAS